MAHYDTTHVGVELLSCQLQVLICSQLLLSHLCQAPYLLPSKLHKLLFSFNIALVLSPSTVMISLVSLGADSIDFSVTLSLLFRALSDFLRPRRSRSQGHVRTVHCRFRLHQSLSRVSPTPNLCILLFLDDPSAMTLFAHIHPFLLLIVLKEIFLLIIIIEAAVSPLSLIVIAAASNEGRAGLRALIMIIVKKVGDRW